ncbi:putative DNA-binding protein [Clostridium sp. ZS2-4]|uniref:putative DNA-binding protein n=1 Tax=Clostridium sp. ZS2-4 TaxID=2987703 RepID=UPI00227D3B5E|nr:putative DNA-binding protein [Clostridium sp. ZS2-4]MCY6356705.1 putative DNA-binding protein [Clostridium sp. ZS2-4]
MEDRIKTSILLDYYKELLTEKQKDIMELYFNQDLSLSEISELTNTSRQAIYDIIKRCNKLLIDYEDKLKLMKKNDKIKSEKEFIIKKINRLQEENNDNQIETALQELKDYISESI